MDMLRPMIKRVGFLLVIIFIRLETGIVLMNSPGISTTDISKSSSTGDDEDIRTIGNYIRLESEMAPKLSEILETFKEDLTTTSSDISTDTTGKVNFHLDNIVLTDLSDTHKTSNDDITEKEEGSDYEDETSTDEHEYEIEEDEEVEEEEEEEEEDEEEEEEEE